MIHYFLLFLLAFTLAVPQGAEAQRPRAPQLNADSGYEPIVPPVNFETSVTIDDDDEEPAEPNIAAVEFLRPPPVNEQDLEGRVKGLIEGIEVDIPPEYDHYGYEIRRYMANVGNMKIFTDEEYLKEQIKNVRKAAVIAKFWKEKLEEEIDKLEVAIEEPDARASFAVRSAFKQNKITIATFVIVLQSWIDSNERVLMHIFNFPGAFEILYPEVIIENPEINLEYYNRMLFKQVKLKELVNYTPFAMMVY